METFSDDLRYVIHRANLTRRIPESELSRLFNRSRPRKESGAAVAGAKENLTAAYMEMLDEDTKKKLVEIYKPDFEMFGYSPHEY